MKQTFTLILMAVCLSLTLHATAQVSETIALPDGLLQGTIQDSKIILSWNVSQNKTYNLFQVEKSNNGNDFTPAGLVFTSDKTGSENYLYKNSITLNQPNYYRVKMVTGNAISYSNVIAVKPETNPAIRNITLLQNPVHDNLSFNYKPLANANCMVSVYNVLGVKVYSTTITCYKGSNVINLKTGSLNNGVYVLQVKTDYNQSTAKFIKD